ncbi:MAG: biopolymer transporter ExbD [Candidatus Latescibacteria bacterium]|nr:biopolymer transporter ExbD [Candidatus Latescibacterota bacterium]
MKSRFKKRKKINQEIPTGTMADISFLLIIFFMVTTVFVVYRGFPVNLPRAERIDPMKSRRNIVSVWVNPQGRVMVDEFETELSGVAGIVRQKLEANPRVVVLVKSDSNTPYRMVSGVIEELKRAQALRVSFIAKRE